MGDLLSFLAKAVFISLSGVMAPGPVTAATIAAGTDRRHAGALIAAGHGIVELPLMLIIVAGAARFLESGAVRIGVGLAGGLYLLAVGAQTVIAARRPPAVGAARARGPLVTGIVLTAGNPYFLLWWATAGLVLAVQAVSLGPAAFAIFAAVHWLCDLAWLEVLSLAAHSGSKLLGPGRQQVIGGICGAALSVFGVWFVYDAVRAWLG